MDGIWLPMALFPLLLVLLLALGLRLLLLSLLVGLALLRRLRVLILLVGHLLVLEVLQFPQAVPLSLAHLRVRLLYEDDVGDLQLFLVVLVYVADVLVQQIVAEDRVVVVYDVAEVCAYDEGLVVYAEVLFASYFDGYLTEFLFEGSAAVVEVVVHVLDIEHDELAHPVSAEDCSKAMLPVSGLVDFKWLHGLHIKNMH